MIMDYQQRRECLEIHRETGDTWRYRGKLRTQRLLSGLEAAFSSSPWSADTRLANGCFQNFHSETLPCRQSAPANTSKWGDSPGEVV